MNLVPYLNIKFDSWEVTYDIAPQTESNDTLSGF